MVKAKLAVLGLAFFYLLSLFPVHAQNCTEFWVCTDWSFCLGSGINMRTCKDVNRCGTENTKPPETQNCTPAEIRDINLPENQETGGITGLLLTNTPALLGIAALALAVVVYLTYKKWKDIRMFISSP